MNKLHFWVEQEKKKDSVILKKLSNEFINKSKGYMEIIYVLGL